MNTQSIIYDLFNSNQTVSEIAQHLISNNLVEFNDITLAEQFVEKNLQEIKEEIEADAYLSSMDCYYDNFCN